MNRPYWVYRCYDSTGRLIYVGCTSNLWQRLSTHRSKSWWAPQVSRVHAKVYRGRNAAGSIERRAIADESPRWNIVGRWASHSSWTREDFEDYVKALRSTGPIADVLNQHKIARACRIMAERFPEGRAA
jgi:excinuclease UvrABC nuclease subunit